MKDFILFYEVKMPVGGSVKRMVKAGVMFGVSLGVFLLGASASAAYTGEAGSFSGHTGPASVCTLVATPSTGTVPFTVTLTGRTFKTISPGLVEAYNNINRGDGTFSGAVTGAAFGPLHARFQARHTYMTPGTFPISNYMIYATDPNYTRVDKNASARCVAKNIVATAQRGDGPDGPFCGNSVVEGAEQCDEGANNGMPGYGCSTTCKILIPKCDVTVTPTSGPIPLGVVVTVTGAGGRVLSIDRTDTPVAVGPWMGTPVPGSPYTSFITGHTYTMVGTFGVVVTMFNPSMPNLTRKCTTSVMTWMGNKEGTGRSNATGRGNNTGWINMTGIVHTGVISTGVKANTGIIIKPIPTPAPAPAPTPAPAPAPAPTPTPSALGNITPAVAKNISQWAYRYGITTLPLSETQLTAQLTRYSVADMFVRFVKNVKKQTISRSALCDITRFSDYSRFTTDMRTTITAICDLGVMGLSADQRSLIRTFDIAGPITSDQLRTIINRYQPGMLVGTTTLSTRNIDFLLHLYLIASKK